MVVADLVLAPYQCSEFDLESAEELQSQLASILPVNPTLRVLVYHAIASTNIKVRDAERQEFIAGMVAFPEFQLLESIGHSRKVYKDAAKLGRSVLETKNPDAVEEIQTLLKEVFNV
jgi:chromosome partitioning protein